jgi:hypothetical protein
MQSNFGVLLCKLNGEDEEDRMEVVSVPNLTGTKERRYQSSVRATPFHDCLCNCGLSCPGKPTQPEDRGPARVFDPRLYFFQDGLPRALEAASMVATLASGPLNGGIHVHREPFGWRVVSV